MVVDASVTPSPSCGRGFCFLVLEATRERLGLVPVFGGAWFCKTMGWIWAHTPQWQADNDKDHGGGERCRQEVEDDGKVEENVE